MTTPDTALPAAARDALARGDTIGAIKAVREATGLGLKEAKDAVEAWQRGTPPAGVTPAPGTRAPALPAEAVAALRAGHRIEAIRLVRESAGVDLRTAKDAVDDFERRQPDGRAPAGTIQVGGGGGSLAWAAAAIAAASLAWWFLARH